ncbi:MAG: META domain-containing protein [Mangrovibacterium sp.]
MKRAYIMMFALLVLFASCSNVGRKLTNVSEVSQIEGEWKFVHMNGEPVDNPRAFMAFVDGKRVGGSTGCNNFSAAMDFDGSDIIIGEVLTTRKMCADMDFEQFLVRSLTRSQWKAQFSADTLVLSQEQEDNIIELVRKIQAVEE